MKHDDVLGRKAEDRISGFKGVVSAYTKFVNGCVRVCLSPKVDKSGALPDGQWFDIEQVAVSDKRVIDVSAQTGGDRPDHPSRNRGPR